MHFRFRKLKYAKDFYFYSIHISVRCSRMSVLVLVGKLLHLVIWNVIDMLVKGNGNDVLRV